MNVLIVVSNRSAARMVKEFLEKHVNKIIIDVAYNLPILKNRLENIKYDYIIADIVSMINQDDIIHEFNKVQTPIIMWTLAPMSTSFESSVHSLRNQLCGIVKKPLRCTEEMMKVLQPVLI